MKKQVVGGLALSLIFGSDLFGTPQDALTHQTGDENRITIRIDPTIAARVINYTAATPATMAKAEYKADQILGEAGLHVIWLDCPRAQSAGITTDPCEQPLKPTEIVLRVLSDHRRRGVQDDAFGFAVPPVLASVYYGHSVGLARSEGVEFEVSTILACVIAHEIGHLLLGSNSHSDTGIMQGEWGRKQVRQLMWGNLHFTPQQSKLIRVEGQMRMRLESAQLRISSSTN
jgi:hypothetical protein